MAPEGYLDSNDGQFVYGWAIDFAQPDRPVEVEVRLSGRLLGCVTADTFRADLLSNGIGSGSHSFHFALPRQTGTTDHGVVSVRIKGTAFELKGSPSRRNLEPAVAFVAGDIVNNCNLRCPFCMVDYKNIRGLKLMEPETFERVAELAPAIAQSGLWLSCLHEPTLHPQFLDLVETIPAPLRDRVSFTTNLSKKLSDDVLMRLARSGLGSIRVSFDSRNPELFAELRKGARYEVFHDNLTRLARFLRSEPGSPWLQIVTMAFRDNFREIPELFAYCRNELGSRGHDIRFIYYFPHVAEWGKEHILSPDQWAELETLLAPYAHHPHLTLCGPRTGTREQFEEEEGLKEYVARETAFGDAGSGDEREPPDPAEIGSLLTDRPLRLRLRYDGLLGLEDEPTVNFRANIRRIQNPLHYFETMRAAAKNSRIRV